MIYFAGILQKMENTQLNMDIGLHAIFWKIMKIMRFWRLVFQAFAWKNAS